MEQLVLGIFQEQLSKVIVDFRKEQVNANLLNGKGEITDISLNCVVINEQVSRMTPFIEFEEIHVSRLGFHVTSWTNIRQAPIVVDIGTITARVNEPLQCLPRHKRKRLQMLSLNELEKMIKEGFKPLRGNGSYGLADRIVDNMTIEMECFRLDVQTWGRFKTKRRGPWTPPMLQIEYNNLKVAMVDENGNEASPDQVWAHNRGRRQHFMIYKKVQGECVIRLAFHPISTTSSDNSNNSSGGKSSCAENENNVDNPKSTSSSSRPLQTFEIAQMQMEVQTAVRRRLKDGACLAVQMDTTIPRVECNLDSESVHQLAHLATGMQFCFAKDRSFDDPLKPNSDDDLQHHTPHAPTLKMLSRVGSTDTIPDDIIDDSDRDEEMIDDSTKPSDNTGFDLSRIDGDVSMPDGDAASTTSGSMIDGVSIASDDDDNLMLDDGTSSKDGSLYGIARSKRLENPVVLLPNGLVIYSSISITCSVHEFAFKARYPEKEDSFIVFEARGCVTEALWPKIDNDHGFYAQMSTSYVALQERYDKRTRTLLLGGMQRDDHLSRQLPSTSPKTIRADDFFPLFERRWIRDDPIDLRHLFPTQAFGVKTTISLKRNDNTPDEDDKYAVLHEMGVDEMDIVLDTNTVKRMAEFFLGKNGKRLDPRWQSGDWTDEIIPGMLKEPSAPLLLDDHLQHPKLILLDDNFMPSSELFNVTAKFTNVEMKIPCAIHDNLRSCDLSMKWKETTIVVSSLLPRTFLSGEIGSSVNSDGGNNGQKSKIDFPNDPSDICYSVDEINSNAGTDVSPISTFRFQFTTNGFEMLVVPIIPFCKATEPRRVISLNNSTAIFCFEGRPPTDTNRDVTITIILSVLVHDLAINTDIELYVGALVTLLHHRNNVEMVASITNELYPKPPKVNETILNFDQKNDSDSFPLTKSLKGRKMMVQRRLFQSRETGGLSVVFCMQQNNFCIRVWRQNVSPIGPFRKVMGDETNDIPQWHSDRLIDVLKISEFDMKDFEVAVEFDFHGDNNYRTVVKSFLQKAHLQLCDVEKDLVPITHTEEKETGSNMLDILFFGMGKLPGDIELSGKSQQFALRVEGQHREEGQSWSMAADMTSPSFICLHAKAAMNATIQILEILLLPSFATHSSAKNKSPPFPPGTIGSMLFELIEANFDEQHLVDLSTLKISDDKNDPIVERYLRSVCKLVLPSNLDVILLHCEVGNLLMSIPDESNDDETSKELSLLLHQAEIICRFYPVQGSLPRSIENVLACKGMDWTTLIDTSTDGLFLRFSARQSLLVRLRDTIEKVIQPFEVSAIYTGGKVNLSMIEDFLIDDIRLIERFQSRLKHAIWGSIDSLSHVALVVSAMEKQITDQATIEDHASDATPLELKASTFAECQTTKVQNHLQNLRHFLELLDKEVRVYYSRSQLALRQRDDEIEAAKIAIFKKERERMGLLSLMSSKVAGWIRVAAIHRTGQRIAKKTLVWPHYAVLRKDLIVLFSGPSSGKPLDVISLHNATIRLLAGGQSKQDVKRAFALIEKSGMTRYFVSQSAQEFKLWTEEIVAAIRLYSDEDFALCVQKDPEIHGNDARLSFADGKEDCQNDDGDEVRRGIGNRLTSAYQSVRLKGKEISERRKIRSSDFGLEEGEGPNDLGHSNSATGDYIEEERRRAQIAKRLTVVGQATKNKLGSALQTARQKGAELSSRRFRNDGSIEGCEPNNGSGDTDPSVPRRGPDGNTGRLQIGAKLGSAIQSARMKAAGTPEKGGRFPGLRGKLGSLGQGRGDVSAGASTPRCSSEVSLHPTDENNNMVSWTCEACTFLNTSKEDSCEMCGTDCENQNFGPGIEGSRNVSKMVDMPMQPNTDQRPMSTEEATTFGVDDASRSSQIKTDSDPDGNASKIFGSRLTLRKRDGDILDDSVFGSRNIALRNVRLSARTPPAAFDLSDKVKTPLKTLEGQWFVSVNVHAQRVVSTSTISRNTIITADGLLNPVKNKHDPEEETLSNRNLSNERSLSGPCTEDATPKTPSEQIEDDEIDGVTMHQSVLVRVFDCRSTESCEKPISEKVLTLGDVLFLYSQISESIETVLTQLIPTRPYEEDEAGLIGTTNQTFRSLVAEKVLVSGRILGGLLDGLENQSLNSDGFHQYLSEAIEYFFNAVLACPLPVDGLAIISEAVGISAAAIDSEGDISSPSTSLNSTETISLIDLDSRISKILSILSASHAELKRIEFDQPRAMHETTHPSKKQPARKEKSHSYHFPKSLLHEPLIPPSLTRSIHESIREALQNVMSERDEAHAKLIGENVFSIHKVERERKKSERLEYDAKLRREIARIQLEKELQHPNLGNLFGNQEDKMAKMRLEIDKKIESFQSMISTNGDEEMMQLCAQLSAEIAEKTSNELEIERLKSVRVIEQKTQEAERKALEDEVQRLKQLLVSEQERNRQLEEEKNRQR